MESGIRFETVPELATERLLLRGPRLRDAPDINVFASDPEVQRYNAKPHESLEETRAAIEDAIDKFERGEEMTWAVTLRDSGRVIGGVSLFDWNRYHRYAQLGYDLAQDCWGRGLASEALRAVIGFGFATMQLNRFEVTTLAVNERSIKLLHRLGFQREGTRRRRILEDDGSFQDSALFGLLQSEWPTP
jgi:ribosomal-protein-alanine N-acetyltransferase